MPLAWTNSCVDVMSLLQSTFAGWVRTHHLFSTAPHNVWPGWWCDFLARGIWICFRPAFDTSTVARILPFDRSLTWVGPSFLLTVSLSERVENYLGNIGHWVTVEWGNSTYQECIYFSGCPGINKRLFLGYVRRLPKIQCFDDQEQVSHSLSQKTPWRAPWCNSFL